MRAARLLTVLELSGALQLHPKTVYNWKQRGWLPFVTIAGRVRFDPDEVDKFIKERSQAPLPLLPFPKVDLSLQEYDRLLLKGGRSAVSKASRRWNYGFGAIYLRKTKRGNDRWYIDCQDGQGKRRRQVVKDAQSRGEALIALQSRVAEVFNGKFNLKRQREPMKFSELAVIYLEDYARANKKSWMCDKYCLEAHLKPYFACQTLTDVSPLLVERYRAERLKSGVQKSTTNRELALLKKMFNLAIDWGFASANPVLKVRLFSEKDNLKERILSEEEETKLLAHCASHFKPIVIAALNTGMRRNEILSLKWSEVDLKQRQILVTRTKAGRNRLIPVNDALLEVLRGLKAVSRSEYVFTSSKGKQFSTIRRPFTKACHRAGITGLRFHDLRHTFGTRLIRSGVDIVTVQNLLGHYSVTVTQRYTHTDAEQKQKAVDQLTARAGQIPERLSHIWHTGKKKDQVVQLNHLISMN